MVLLLLLFLYFTTLDGFVGGYRLVFGAGDKPAGNERVNVYARFGRVFVAGRADKLGNDD